ncbi:MAG: hypothetical protein K8I27_14165 [Planctomycetes bacterium]|nr:hypothetical protein [Planctomycetota bacterium]
MQTGAVSKAFALMACVALMLFSSACNPNEDSSSYSSKQVRFNSPTLPATNYEPGEVIAIDISGSSSSLDEGFFVRFTLNGKHVLVPPFHVDAGQAFVMVPPMPEVVTSGIVLAICDLDGNVMDTHPQTIGVSATDTTPEYTRASFDAALEQGLSEFVNMAVDCVDTLETQSFIDAASAGTIRGALNQQADIYATLSLFNDNLDDNQLALAQQMLKNTGLLAFIADAGGVSLAETASQTSPQSYWLSAMIESALLKADFASLLIGEVRGALNLLAWVMNQISGWPFIGGWARGVATWATGLSATLQPAHELINTMVPSDLVQITTSQPNISVGVGQEAIVTAKARFETEGAFNQALFTQTVTSAVNQASAWVTNQMNQSPVLAPVSGYVQQVAALAPQWINSWMVNNGYIQQTVVPGGTYTALAIDNFNMDMSQYRFDVAGIVANLINLPYSAVNSFFRWIGIGVGQPVGGFAGVETSSNAQYVPNQDSIKGLSAGSGTGNLIGVVCRPATGWWAQWGFYGIKSTKRAINVTVY